MFNNNSISKNKKIEFKKLVYFINFALRGTRTLTLKALVPKTSVSTNSTRRALINEASPHSEETIKHLQSFVGAKAK